MNRIRSYKPSCLSCTLSVKCQRLRDFQLVDGRILSHGLFFLKFIPQKFPSLYGMWYICTLQSELELLMMEEEGQKDRAHFSLDAILQSEEKAGKKRRKRKETSQVPLTPRGHMINPPHTCTARVRYNLVHVCVCLSVATFSATTRKKSVKERIVSQAYHFAVPHNHVYRFDISSAPRVCTLVLFISHVIVM